MLFLYNLLLALLLPSFPLLKLKVRERGELSLLPRLSTSFRKASGKYLLHVASVGEVNSVAPLVERLRGELSLTVFTDYGLKRARERYPEVPSRLLPLDLYPLSFRFLKRSSPRALLIYESEIWPSLLKAAEELSIPTLFVSGKLSERAFKRLFRLKPFLSKLLKGVHFLARSREDAQRAEALGFGIVELVGDLKLDYAPPKKLPPLFLEGRRKLILWGSTHEGEEELAVKVHLRLREKFDGLLTVIAPRHTGRSLKLPLKSLTRSSSLRVPREVEFYVVDTVGELSGLYYYCDVAVVGGSFVKGVGGHNPVEPVAFKKPTVVGPYATEFSHLVELLKVKVSGEGEIAALLSSLLSSPELSSRLGESSYRIWLESRGVSDRIATYLEERIEGRAVKEKSFK